MLVGRPKPAEASLISGELKYSQGTNSIWLTLAGMAELDNSHSDCCLDPHFANVTSWIEGTGYYYTQGIPAFHYPDGPTVRGMVALADLAFGGDGLLTMKYYLEPDSFDYDWQCIAPIQRI